MIFRTSHVIHLPVTLVGIAMHGRRRAKPAANTTLVSQTFRKIQTKSTLSPFGVTELGLFDVAQRYLCSAPSDAGFVWCMHQNFVRPGAGRGRQCGPKIGGLGLFEVSELGLSGIARPMSR